MAQPLQIADSVSGTEGNRRKSAYCTKWKLIPSGREGIRRKFAYEIEADSISGREGIRRKSAYEMEADSIRERGDTAQI